MRVFIGLDFDMNLKENLFAIQGAIKDNSIKGSWVALPNFHLTLKFLGNIEEEKIHQIDGILQDVALNSSPIALSLDRLGYFNRTNNEYRVIWIGLKGEIEKLNNIYNKIELEMERIGFPMEKRSFTPHITLGRRVKTNLSFDQMKEIVDGKLNYDFLLDNLVLMKSEEVRRKRVYTPIISCTLGNNYEKGHR
ncbi:MAG: RNA 2',3'-cyclic phosphodiesterase [Tissierellia bacterium]|nr:RNA 2',3'-cyclic phosphodiesterase [Tissierellia bacterium]